MADNRKERLAALQRFLDSDTTKDTIKTYGPDVRTLLNPKSVYSPSNRSEEHTSELQSH